MTTVVLIYLLASVLCGYSLFNTSPKTGTAAALSLWAFIFGRQLISMYFRTCHINFDMLRLSSSIILCRRALTPTAHCLLKPSLLYFVSCLLLFVADSMVAAPGVARFGEGAWKTFQISVNWPHFCKYLPRIFH